ncbi:GTP 3',8-cyclase, mitochondrial [Pleodorina starrii]|uniref:GTP 3',8-cyclase n=1 Tax=Pleodorina starrii TaxID=330485 RepID=A0A9W6F3J9_9CHLO|nr:GTP 3',8-cyclase, mitochondrial [Pleodorina starrii]
MTRQSFVRCLARYSSSGRSRAWPAQQLLPVQLDCSQLTDDEPSTSYSRQTLPADRFGLARGSRGFCSWPAPAHATTNPTTAASQAHPPDGQLLTHWVIDPASAAEYDRRLREFLSASRSFQELPASRHPPDPRPGHAPPAVAAAEAAAPEAAAPSPPAASASAARERARAAIRDVPVFTPSKTTGCSSGSSSGSSSGATVAAAAQPQPQPHPASPTPVDWREMLELARQALGSRQVAGAEMLTDKFSRTHTYLRISLTERCNLRCTYCMPDEGVELTPGQQLLTTPEIMRLARIFVEAGVTKVRLTGGEPTLRRDIGEVVRQLAELRPVGLRSVALTSNGIVLARQLPALKEAGLTAVNISLDTLRPERFEQLARRPGHKRVLESIRTAVTLGYDPVKVNVVVMRGVNDDEVADFAALTAHQPINVRFIEYMPFDGNVWSDSKMVPYRELVSRIQSAFPDTPLERLDDPSGEVAKNFRLRGHRGSVSFITSMTQHFCSDCNRLRLLADGNLKVCLFGASEVSLRDAMRGGATDDELRSIISLAVGRKRAAHAGMWELAASANRPMITIGG